MGGELRRSRRRFLGQIAGGGAGAFGAALLSACGSATSTVTATAAATGVAAATATTRVSASSASAASSTKQPAAQTSATGSAASAEAVLAPTPGPTVAPAKGAVTVAWGGEDDPFVAAGHIAEVAAYNKMQDKIHVDYIPITGILGAAPAKLQTMIAGGSAPDLFELGSAYYISAVRQGVLLDLTSYINQSATFNKDDFFPVVWDAFLYQNRVYTIPREGAPTVLFYNVDLFQRAGIPLPPTTLKDADSWTNDAFLAAAAKLTQKAGGGTSVYGYYSAEAAWWPFLFSYGGNVLSDDNTKCVLDSDQSVAAFQWMQDSIYKQQVGPTPEVLAKTAANTVFESGNTAMIFTRRSQNGQYAKAIHGFTWKLGPFPKGPAGHHSDMISNSVSVDARTKHPAEAFEAASFMESTQGHLIRMQYAQQIGVPQRKSVVASPQFLNNVMSPAENQLVIDQIADAKFQPPMTPAWTQISNLLNPALASIWENKGNPRDILGGLVGPINALLAKQGG